MTIRTAQESDFAQVTELLEELGRPRVRPADYGELRDLFMSQLTDPHTEHLVAIDAGAVIGFCSLHFRRRLNRIEPEGWIPDLIVTRDARGHGTARALLLEAESRARKRGCWAITLESGNDRREAHLLYRAAGMAELGKSFGKPVRRAD
ncbi:MAG: GNAT family N-acetyltransferase [Actinomycetota bacterium]|nr:GNAT family N-acetyltransferase [Actinomycetota bacterium]